MEKQLENIAKLKIKCGNCQTCTFNQDDCILGFILFAPHCPFMDGEPILIIPKKG